jgi:hypothetical protein
VDVTVNELGRIVFPATHCGAGAVMGKEHAPPSVEAPSVGAPSFGDDALSVDALPSGELLASSEPASLVTTPPSDGLVSDVDPPPQAVSAKAATALTDKRLRQHDLQDKTAGMATHCGGGGAMI